MARGNAPGRREPAASPLTADEHHSRVGWLRSGPPAVAGMLRAHVPLLALAALLASVPAGAEAAENTPLSTLVAVAAAALLAARAPMAVKAQPCDDFSDCAMRHRALAGLAHWSICANEDPATLCRVSCKLCDPAGSPEVGGPVIVTTTTTAPPDSGMPVVLVAVGAAAVLSIFVALCAVVWVQTKSADAAVQPGPGPGGRPAPAAIPVAGRVNGGPDGPDAARGEPAARGAAHGAARGAEHGAAQAGGGGGGGPTSLPELRGVLPELRDVPHVDSFGEPRWHWRDPSQGSSDGRRFSPPPAYEDAVGEGPPGAGTSGGAAEPDNDRPSRDSDTGADAGTANVHDFLNPEVPSDTASTGPGVPGNAVSRLGIDS